MKHIFKKLHIGSNQDPNHRSNDPPSSSPSSLSPTPATSSAQTSGPSPTAAAAAAVAAPPSNRQQDYYSSEEEYQVQLALALSVSGVDRDDKTETDRIRGGLAAASSARQGGGNSAKERDDAADSLSRQYWDYSVLDYGEKVVDGFYDIYGLSTGPTAQGKMPSLAELETKPGTSGFEVILVNRRIDHSLEELLQVAHCISLDCSSGEVSVLVLRLAELVTEHLGGPVKDANVILAKWVERSTDLRTSLHTTVLPIGSLKIGLSRHRALLFKVLADNVGLPCRLVKGSHYTGVEDDAVNIIKLENETEFLVDLMGAPGALIPADILSTKDMSLQLSKLPSFQTTHASGTFYPIPKPLLGQFEGSKNSMAESSLRLGQKPTFEKAESSPSLTHASNDNGVGSSKASLYKGFRGPYAPRDGARMNVNRVPLARSNTDDPQSLFADLNPFQMKGSGRSSVQNNQVWNKAEEPRKQRNDLVSGRPPVPLVWKNRQAHNEVPRKEYLSRNDSATSSSASSSSNASEIVHLDISKLQISYYPSQTDRDDYTQNKVGKNDALEMEKDQCKNTLGMHDLGKQTHDRLVRTNMKFKDHESLNSSFGSSANVIDPVMDDVGDCEIPWEHLVIGERIGLGSYGEVYRADWNGTEVAVKKFLDQDFSGDALDEFRREVRIMRRLRHDNVVTFMGAVTRPPNLSIVTEFLPRGSLYRIIHRRNCQIDEKRRIKMALDVAEGMNCLHLSTPTIVHRDLKSPNLLVDNNWNVKVCDFGLSRLKHNTFLSSKSTAGTPEWMAPEVLRNELSSEKCDIYSFGVILWELATLKMPWSGMNPMQVVGAVGFQNRRLEISKDIDPLVASIISHCWLTDPTKRPSFGELTEALKQLQHLVIPSNIEQQDSSFSQ